MKRYPVTTIQNQDPQRSRSFESAAIKIATSSSYFHHGPTPTIPIQQNHISTMHTTHFRARTGRPSIFIIMILTRNPIETTEQLFQTLLTNRRVRRAILRRANRITAFYRHIYLEHDLIRFPLLLYPNITERVFIQYLHLQVALHFIEGGPSYHTNPYLYL